MLVFYIVFNVLLSRGGPDFIQFLLIGLIAWKWFGTTVQHCGNSLMGAKGLIGQAALPKLIFPTVFILTDTFKTIIVAVIVSFVLIATGFHPNQAYLALPILFLTQFLMITAVGYFLAAIVPFFPDLSILINLLLRMLWFLSGVFFDPKNISEAKQRLFFINPMARLINDYRGILMHQRWPEIFPLVLISIFSILLIIITTDFIRRYDKIYPRIVTQ
jgi:lipopolysaccharide transport system permease protein